MDKNKEIGQRIKKRRLELGLTQGQVGNRIGVAKSTIQRYENGLIKDIKMPVIQAIAHVLSVNPNWIVLKSENKHDVFNVFTYDDVRPIKKQKVPLIGEIACGQPIVANEEWEGYIEAGTNIKADYCLRCKGDSMINARILDGDIVFIKQQPTVENGEIAAVIIEDEVTLKRVYRFPDEQTIMLQPENPKYKSLIFSGSDAEQIKILGKAVAFQSDIK